MTCSIRRIAVIRDEMRWNATAWRDRPALTQSRSAIKSRPVGMRSALCPTPLPRNAHTDFSGLERYSPLPALRFSSEGLRMCVSHPHRWTELFELRHRNGKREILDEGPGW